MQEKFVGRGRGGYCFERATLVHAALGALGYAVELHLDRVGDPHLAGRCHLVVVATLDGSRYLVDPGIGVPPLGPIPLRDGGLLDGAIWPHEVRHYDEGRAGNGWQWWRKRSYGWELMHTVDELPVRRIDVEIGHWFHQHQPGLALHQQQPGRAHPASGYRAGRGADVSRRGRTRPVSS